MIPYPRSLRPLVLALLLTGLALGFNAGPAFAQNVQVGPFTLPAGETVTIEFEALITDPFPANASSVSNQGTVTFDGSGPVLTDDPDVIGTNNPTVTPVIQEIDADLSITKSGPTQVATGGTIDYALMVSNSGPDAAPNVVVEDTLPSGVTFVTASPECTHASGTVTCTLLSVPVSPPTVNLAIQVTAPTTPGLLTNSVTVDSDATDPNSGNNSATFDTTVAELEADLSVAKSDSPDPVQAGQQLVYTVSVTNAGPDPAVNVVASDTLPAGVAFGSTSGCAESPSGGVPTCTLGDIAAGSSKQYTITVTVNSGTPDGTILTNGVSVTSDTPDPTTPNTATAATTVTSVVLCGGSTPTTGCTVNGVRNQVCRGTLGTDTITGTNGRNVIHGRGGNDTISGGNDNDTICGGDGPDTLNGANGNDRLFGENGNNVLNGDNGNDSLDGGADTDACNGGSGTDTATAAPSCNTTTGVP